MHLERYDTVANEDLTRLEFWSDGPKGRIHKIVEYQLISMNFYNLAFGDWQKDDNTVSDKVRTNNHDRDKVLATVAYTLTGFFHFILPQVCLLLAVFQPEKDCIKWEYVQIGVLSWTCNDVRGFFEEDWEYFSFNRNYDAFLVTVREIF